MINAQIIADLKAIEDFGKFKLEIREKVIEKGLDLSLDASLQKLQRDLNYLVNTRVTSSTSPDTKKDSLDNTKVILPKSDQEILKHLTGIDLEKVNKSNDYSTPTKSGVMLVDNYRVRLRLPISPFSEFDEVFAQAKKFFNDALFVIRDGNQVKYLKNPGIDISDFVKVVCSTDSGDTDKARKKFEHYRDSNKMSRQANSDIGRFAEWSLRQEGMKRIMDKNSGFVDLTSIVNKIKEGDINEAIEIAKNIQDKNTGTKIVEQIQSLNNSATVNPTTQAYLNVVQLIKNLKIVKSVYPEVVTYGLSSNVGGNLEDIEDQNLYQELQKNITLWLIENENIWFSELVKVAEKTIQDFYKAG